MVLRSEAAAVRYALPEAAAEASRASATAVVRQPEAAAVLRAQAGAAAGQAGAVELPREAAAVAALLWVAAAAEVARAGAGAAVRQQAVAALRDVGRRRAVQPSAAPWVCHPDQALPWPELPPAGRFARAMQAPRIALP